MSRRLAIAMLLAPSVALAQPAPSTPSTTASATDAASPDDDIGDQGIGAELGVAGGGRVTPGGLRVAGHYLYQLSDQDWFDGAASFTFGGGGAACFRDRDDDVLCDHGFLDGRAVEISASVRRVFAAQGDFRPFARAGVGISFVQFSDDDKSGVAIPLHAGGGVRAKVAPAVAVVVQGELVLGIGKFGGGLGMQPQVGVALTAGAEFRLR